MSKKKKCPSCGLVNFHDAAQCQWCALVLRGRARNEMVDDLPRSGGVPWGVLLLLFALLVMGGGVFRHFKQKLDERAELAAEKTEAAAKSAKRGGPPKLSGRSPSDPRPEEIDYIGRSVRLSPEELKRNEELQRKWRGLDQKFEPRDMFGRPVYYEGREKRSDDEEPQPPPTPDDREER